MENKVCTNDYLEYSDEDFINLTHQCFGFSNKGLKRRFKYRMTNRNIRRLKDFIGDMHNKRILATSGSGIPLFSLLNESNGIPKFILGFDYSPKQVAYNYLVKNSIINLEYEEFLIFFGYNKNGIRTEWVKLMRRKIITKIPNILRPFVPRNHELTKRDLILKNNSECSFFSDKENYKKVKKNIQLIKFFIFNLNPFCKESLSDIFKKESFNFIYLSNVLDWICWHNSVQHKDIKRLFHDLKKVSEKGSSVIVDHLTQRRTLLSEILTKTDKLKKEDYSLYIYNWAMYKILLNNI
ncbi:MAG: hypothetical protein PHY40_00430 [Patescibacteria group bacterium]|nr:hypothetical protein [Patescibacteria group bacterium]